MGVENNIPEGWMETTLGEVAVIGSSKRIFFSEYVDKGIPFYRSKEIIQKQKGNNISTELFITEEKYDNLKNNFGAPQENDILLTSVGTLGIPYRVRKNEIFYFKDGNLTWFRDYQNIESAFLYNWFLSSTGKHQLNKITIGSTQSALTISGLKSIEILLPPINEQIEITNIINAFDDKIELLQAQNKTLETMAQTIFKEWFGKYQIGDELPEGWRDGNLGDIAINHSHTYKFTDKEVVFINTGDVLKGEFLHSDKVSPIGLPGQAKKVIQLHDILYSEIRPKNKRFAFVDFDTSNYVVSTKFMIIRPKFDFSPFILYLILKNQETIDEFNVIAESRSGTFPQITFDSIKDFPIVIPSFEAKEKFENVLKPIMDKQRVNNNQLKSLTKTRDTLLPKLMSGQVRVKNLKQTADA